MRIDENTVVGWGGLKKPTPKWAAMVSNYLLLVTVGIFIISGFIDDWSAFIPDTSKFIIEEAIGAVEKSLITVATALRFLGVKPDESAPQ